MNIQKKTKRTRRGKKKERDFKSEKKSALKESRSKEKASENVRGDREQKRQFIFYVFKTFSQKPKGKIYIVAMATFSGNGISRLRIAAKNRQKNKSANLDDRFQQSRAPG